MKEVVIVGGGYGGVAALQQLAPRKDIKVTLIDKHPYHFLQTEGYELIAGTLPFDKTLVNLHTLCAAYQGNVVFFRGGVSRIDLQAKCVYIDEEQQITYDYLIIAAGSVTRFIDSIAGLQSFSYGIKSLKGAFQMRQFFEHELLARLVNSRHSKEHYSVVIGGAGLSGVEIAAEMQHYFNRYYKSNTLACDTLKIHLVSGSDTILKGLPAQVIAKATLRLEKLGVILHKGEHISKVEPHTAILENGETIDFDFMIFTGGIMATPMIRDMEVAHNKIGQIKVDPDLQIPGNRGVFVIGDAAEIIDSKGNRTPDTAQSAVKSGAWAAKNIQRLMVGKKTRAANIKTLGLAIAMGGKYAILHIGMIRSYGLFAYYIKKLVENFYKWPLWLRCRRGLKRVACLRR